MSARDSGIVPIKFSLPETVWTATDERALRSELERCLRDIQDALFQATAETQRRLADAERRVAELERARAVLLAVGFYRLFSRPVIRRPLRLLRRMARRTGHFLRRGVQSGFLRRYRA